MTVFEYNGTGTYVNYFVTGTPLGGSQMTACPAAPWAQSASQFDFTANWTAVDGAAGYVIDVSTSGISAAAGRLAARASRAARKTPTGLQHQQRHGGRGCVARPHRIEFAGVQQGGTRDVRCRGSAGHGGQHRDGGLAASGAVPATTCMYRSAQDGGVLSTNATKLVDGYSNLNIADSTNAVNPTTVSPNPYSIAVSTHGGAGLSPGSTWSEPPPAITTTSTTCR